MVDRQDIDALLIGALYGELTLADEARLTAHLESHPADRSALAGLTSTRDAVRESRIFQVQLDPPQAVSALLLQEAARRAPRRVPTPEEHESWFQRFVRSFMTHPAMAAAAMLVLVVGIAGTMYLRGGDQFADRTAGVAQQAPAAGSGSAAFGRAAGVPQAGDQLSNAISAADPQAPTGAVHTGANSETDAVGLEDKTKDKEKNPAPKVERKAPAAGSGYRVDLDTDNQRMRGMKLAAPGKETVQEETGKQVGQVSKKKLLEVTTPETSPKDLDVKAPVTPVPPQAQAVQQANDHEAQKRDEGADGIVAGGAGNGNGPTNGTAKPQPRTTVTGHAAPPPPPAEVKPADASVASLLAWAQDQHQRVKTLAKAGNCKEVGTLAAEISTRAPDYYRDKVASDRDLKQCMAYINDARASDAERSSKARAQKRNNADEQMPAPTQNK